MIELWAWHRPAKVLVDRRSSPWDDEARRPSHADRRNALRRHCLMDEFHAATAIAPGKCGWSISTNGRPRELPPWFSSDFVDGSSLDLP
jgi:hypothetical protein